MSSKRKLAELVDAALHAQAAGVVLRLKDWNRFSKNERSAWLAARKILADGLTRKEPRTAKPSEADPVTSDPELDSALDRVLDRVQLARGGV